MHIFSIASGTTVQVHLYYSELDIMLRTKDYRWSFSDGEDGEGNLPNMCKGWFVLYMILSQLFHPHADEALRTLVQRTTGWKDKFNAEGAFVVHCNYC